MEPNELNDKPKINWKRLLITVGIVIVTAGAIGGSVYYVMNQQAQKDKESAEKTVQDLQTQIDDLKKTDTTTIPTTNTGTTATTDETANWKTYSNASAKMSFKYPSSWSITREESTNTGEVVAFSADNSETFALYKLDGDGGRGFEGVAKFIRYDGTKISGNKIVLGTKEESNSSSLEGAGPTSGYAIVTITTNGANGKNFSWQMVGKSVSNADSANVTFLRITSTMTVQ